MTEVVPFPFKSSFSMISITLSAASHANGFPAYVPPNSPGDALSTISFLPTTPLKGNPAANDLETVIKSGSTSKCSIANVLPVRAKPV